MKKRDFLKSLILPFCIRKKENWVYTVGVKIDNSQPLRPSEMYLPTPTIEKKNIPTITVSQFVYDPLQVSETPSPSITGSWPPCISSTIRGEEDIFAILNKNK